jgi:inorganic pyrophosphatase
MNIWHDIDSKRIQPKEFIACIEISKGSKKKI